MIPVAEMKILVKISILSSTGIVEVWIHSDHRLRILCFFSHPIHASKTNNNQFPFQVFEDMLFIIYLFYVVSMIECECPSDESSS